MWKGRAMATAEDQNLPVMACWCDDIQNLTTHGKAIKEDIYTPTTLNAQHPYSLTWGDSDSNCGPAACDVARD